MEGRMEGRESGVKDCLQQSKTLVSGRKDGWMEGRKEGKAGLRIAYSNQKCARLAFMLWLKNLDFKNSGF